MKTEPPLTDAQIEQTLRQAGTMEDAPTSALQAALGLWRDRTPATVSLPEAAQRLRRIVARLIEDTFAAPELALGLRGGEAPPRQLFHASDAGDVDLHIAAVDGRWEIRGQLLGRDGAAAARLVALDAAPGDPPADRCVPSAQCEFLLVPPPLRSARRYRIEIDTGDTTIELPPFDLPSLDA